MATPYFQNQGITIYHGSCLDILPELNLNATATITDPPYGLGFMGRAWDGGVPGKPFWDLIKKRMIPGAPLLAFGGTRTFHRQWCAIEDAGFEIRDTLSYMYGTGFPKSHDISKAIDDAKGAEREVVGESPHHCGGRDKHTWGSEEKGCYVTAPATDEAERWDGWGTAMKPSWEPICLATKPHESTYAENALKHGVAGLNIDAVRVEATDDQLARKYESVKGTGPRDNNVYGEDSRNRNEGRTEPHEQGRWPPNAIFDERAAALLDEQSGPCVTGDTTKAGKRSGDQLKGLGETKTRAYKDTESGASRFFYTSKASKDDRTKGMPDGATNDHPTVKPTDLIAWLARLASYPKRNQILDPFAGSGPLAYVAAGLGIKATLIEQDEENAELCAKRVKGQQSMFAQQ